MDREHAMAHILAEAFSVAGLATLVENGEDPGQERLNRLIHALAFLMEELADDDSFGREFVSALFVLGNRVPEQMRNQDGENSRSSLYDQAEELTVAVTALIENWNHWPDWETDEFRTYSFETNSEKSAKESNIEQVGGYRTGDITYCVVPGTTDCYPVRWEKLFAAGAEKVLGASARQALMPAWKRSHRFPALPTIPPGSRAPSIAWMR